MEKKFKRSGCPKHMSPSKKLSPVHKQIQVMLLNDNDKEETCY